MEVRRSLISIRVQMLANLFGKRVTDNQLDSIKRVYGDALENFPERIISDTFNRAEQECERFPTPKFMKILAGELLPSHAWRYSFQKAQRPDPDTGMLVDVLIDPDPTCSVCREPCSLHPNKRCSRYTSTPADDRVMFRQADCPEGRDFAGKFKQIAEKVRPTRRPIADTEIQKQKEILCKRGLLSKPLR